MQKVEGIKIPEDVDKTEVSLLGNLIVFTSIHHDMHAEDPTGWGTNGRFFLFSKKYGWFPSGAEQEEIQSSPDAVPLDVYAHGAIHISVGGSRWYPDERWDVARGGGAWLPGEEELKELETLDLEEGSEERREWLRERAAQCAKLMTAYINGYVYGYAVDVYEVRKSPDGQVYNRRGDYRFDTPLFDASCFGFYDDHEYMIQQMKDQIQYQFENGILEGMK